ncbi:hypothetical protein KL933_003497 [Ogataea haglerorum]|uniref:DNA polymerase n=1 Tax=Ogataea haglerorum TaxID=1937702 RepID=A0AAN6D5Z7_9ASCO|nr:uncharacterized protein KL911_003628 [Ogataea haglerorum]KAG7708058.1 hypothetical protein KL950_002684 [Ogataea haglerorum]KAG7717144.1 hypothetical protein KL913_002895 [Ogataea haglerorum]KAG7719468.1 hypothetical protein KL949_002460 [Ogataea haglerorum]KAG7726566.1 hypothetical protein KL933_003497 [Ogataea haglerorum]KAG7738016.1 hypothetical protein KL923_003563 [Ogataea haglerorum]
MKHDKRARLRAARAGIKLSDEEDGYEDIYEEVDEQQFRQHKQRQLLNDDFIVDDSGNGYAETGADDWDGANEYASEEEDEPETRPRKKIAKIKRDTPQISSFFKGADTENKPTRKVDNLDDILSDFTAQASSNARSTPLFSVKKRADVFSSLKSDRVRPVKPLNVKKLMFEDEVPAKKIKLSSEDEIYAPESDLSSVSKIETPSSPIKAAIKEDDEFSSDDEVDVTTLKTARADIQRVNLSSTRELKETKAADIATSSPTRDASETSMINSTFEKVDESQVVDSETIQLFWIDYAEVDNSLLLFGKVKTLDGRHVSAVVQVNGISREIYFLPRESRLDEDDGPPPTAMDVHEEIIPLLLDKFGLDRIKAKPETKKWAFELENIPKETEYLKVLLPFQTPKSRNTVLPSSLEGETFRHVFGANANIFETFVLQRNVMGPCWLEIKGADFSAIKNSSHCQVEVAVADPAQIKPIDTNMPAPDLTAFSINIQPVTNLKEGKQEIGFVSFAVYRNVHQDTPMPEDAVPDELLTLVRPVGGSLALPPGLSQLAAKRNIPLRSFNNERTLLNCLAALIKKTDPDVFVGHRLDAAVLDVLMRRMHDLKISQWSTVGRRNRKQWPDRYGKGSGRNNMFYLKEIFAGRLCCDIANEMGQSLTSKCQSWDLPEMYDIVCKKKFMPMDVNLANPQFAEDTNLLLAAFNENSMSVKIIAEIAFRVQILSLSKQLTNLAGNAWAHTLGGTRAGRNEYILLHEFTKNGYIVPDKETRSQRQAAAAAAALEQDGDESTATSNKKTKYQGGLVFEPEKGLHKNYILVMDFNSLYPSIIQEFNICFTTVNRSNLGENDLPSVPPSEVAQGVLPRLLQQLVNRRREVKKLLKDPRATAVEKAQYDIKQQALKLTANSMYGCLGYVNSRFYAKSLAMLVTNRGREILMDTRQLAESIGLRVVYGDTDSVMIDTGSDNFQEAMKIGDDFKIKVNERYRLLEIDIDNVFKRLLLHSKKKYAAMNATVDASGLEKTVLEVKGLDMRRREFCPLSKETSTFVLEKILGDADPEDALNDIYTHLEDVKNKLTDNQIPMHKLAINTRLSKDPGQYPGGKSMPAVQVALRLRKQGKLVRAGSVMTFVITDKGQADGDSVADRARAISEILANPSQYRPDPYYYLEKQIFAPIERLLERIEGNDVVRMASALGLDARKYEARARFVQDRASAELQPLDSTVSDSERFRDCKPLFISCTSCRAPFEFGGIQASKRYQVTFSGVKCLSCQQVLSPLAISSQLEHFLRHEISTYYAGWLVCDDCGVKTRQVSVYGRRCIGKNGKAYGCKGIMRYIYPDKQLYNQLLYAMSLFDVDKAKKRLLKPLTADLGVEDKENKLVPMNQGELDALVEQNRESFKTYQMVIDKYLTECGRRYVDMGGIFEFMSVFKRE